MAKKQGDALRAGVFMILSLLAIVFIIVAIKGFARVFMPTQTVTAQFTLRADLGGLNRGDNVRIGGYTVGSVQSINIKSSRPQPCIDVTFTIPKRYVLRKGVYLAVGGTVTGTSWLNFSSLGTGAPIPAGTVIPGHAGGPANELARASAIMPAVAAILHQVRTTTLPKVNTALTQIGSAAHSIDLAAASADKTLSTVQPRVPEIIHHYNRFTSSVAYAMNQAGKLIHSGRKTALPDINVITADIKKSLPGLLRQIHGNLTELHTALIDASGAARDAHRLLSRNGHRINTMIKSLATASANLKLFAIEIHQSPWRLLYRPGKNEQANVQLYDAVREFNDAARNLSNTSYELRKLLKTGAHTAAQKKMLSAYMQMLDRSFSHFRAVESKFWQLVRH